MKKTENRLDIVSVCLVLFGLVALFSGLLVLISSSEANPIIFGIGIISYVAGYFVIWLTTDDASACARKLLYVAGYLLGTLLEILFIALTNFLDLDTSPIDSNWEELREDS